MTQRLPKSLLFLLAVVAAVFFALSMYLESYRLDWLQAHPISVNLLSGAVGFSSGVLAVAVGLNWFIQGAQLQARRGDLGDAIEELESGIRQIIAAVPGSFLMSDAQDSFTSLRSWTRRSLGRRQYVRNWPFLEALIDAEDVEGVMSRLVVMWQRVEEIGSLRPWWTSKGVMERLRHTRRRRLFHGPKQHRLAADLWFDEDPDRPPAFLDATAPGKTVFLYLEEVGAISANVLFWLALALTDVEQQADDASSEVHHQVDVFDQKVSAWLEHAVQPVIIKFGLEGNNRLNESMRGYEDYRKYNRETHAQMRVHQTLDQLSSIIAAIFLDSGVRRFMMMSRSVYVLP